jgi:hypothetical protein
MRKVKEVLRLRFELRFGQRQIARSCRMGLSTVHEYLERAEAAGVGWPLPEDWSEEELEAKLFGQQRRECSQATRRGYVADRRPLRSSGPHGNARNSPAQNRPPRM